MEEGWHKFEIFSGDKVQETLYFNKIDNLPNFLIPEIVVLVGRNCNKKYYNKNYAAHMQDSYSVNNTYFGYYHTIHHDNVDPNGVPLLVYDNVTYYHPVQIAEYALSLYDDNKMTDEEINLFLTCANYLSDNLNEQGGFPYNFDWVMHGIVCKSPWFSGMAQGQMLSVISRAYYLTKNDKYLIAGKRIMDFMITNAGLSYPYNGCKVSLKQFSLLHESLSKYSDFVIYEEYVDKESSYVLNGNLFALVGLHDYYEVSGDMTAYNAFMEGCKSIAVMLPYYDYYGSTSYDLVHLMHPEREPTFNSGYAHDCHIMLLDALFEYTRNELFARYRDNFISYYFPPFVD